MVRLQYDEINQAKLLAASAIKRTKARMHVSSLLSWLVVPIDALHLWTQALSFGPANVTKEPLRTTGIWQGVTANTVTDLELTFRNQSFQS